MSPPSDLFGQPVKPRRRQDFLVPRGARRATCGSCRAPIAWIVIGERDDGSQIRMPLDLSTVHHTPEGTDRAESHFAHCPNAKRHRKA